MSVLSESDVTMRERGDSASNDASVTVSPVFHPTRDLLGRADPLVATALEGSFRFGGVNIVDIDPEDAADHITAAALDRRPLAVHLVNAYTLTLADKNPGFIELLNERAYNLPDGTPVSWFYRLRTGERARGPVRGPDLMKALLARGGMTHFLLGGTMESLDDLCRSLKEDYPGSEIVGMTAPPFRDPTDEDIREYAEIINASGAHLVWVGIGTPRQDHVIAGLVPHVSCVLLGVGAAFDFLSGQKPEAPAYLHGTGLEWVHRLLSEPRRLWRRYLIGNVRYATLAARELIRQRRLG